MISQQEVKERCEWTHNKLKEKMNAVTRHEYIVWNGAKCSITNTDCMALSPDCRKCNTAKRHNAKLAILLSSF